ncbi:ABC transporter substrate-binding protein [Salinisphaera aquimarina]|uniref:Probable sugar-binding periplasmic protein n=1 Tax=Salinisphaera aquimarina TaxID=2094031 RepID=A0ABV7EQA9_9GAMM
MKNVSKPLQYGAAAGLIAVSVLMGGTAVAAADKGEIDVLNWWTSGSEAKSMGVLQKMLADDGYKMVNDAASGGGGANARTVLKSRIQSNNVPGAAQIKGPQIQQWCDTGLVGNIDQVAQSQNWDKLLAPTIAKGMQCDGHWVAVPFNIHRINWLWINRSVLEKVDADIPASWDDLVATLAKLDKAGITPIAGGGNTWQVATEFDAIVAATGGADFYRKAFIELDQDALASDTMAKSFARLRTIKQYTDPNGTGLSWNHDTGMVVKGEAAMQIMGDWAKGEISNNGATPGKEIACVAMPGSEDTFVYNIDSFEMFQVDSEAKQAGQRAFARTAMSPEFQRRFNKAKGSIPVREGVSLDGFDACAQKAQKAYDKAKSGKALVATMSQDNAEVGAVKGAIFDVIARFYNSDSIKPAEAAKQLAQRVKQAEQMAQL